MQSTMQRGRTLAVPNSSAIRARLRERDDVSGSPRSARIQQAHPSAAGAPSKYEQYTDTPGHQRLDRECRTSAAKG
eukprot:14876911-Alexandrium_andersonii.AAC.1